MIAQTTNAGQGFLPGFMERDVIDNRGHSLVVDLFAGGGGASTGMERAGLTVDIAVNHDPEAIFMHRLNHPYTVHFEESVWDVDPVTVTKGRPVRFLWASPDCKDFSKAKGAALTRDKRVRALAWVVIRWADKVKPDCIMLENVEEFRTWGPLDAKGQRIKSRQGEEFDRWVGSLRKRGYAVEWRELRACDYGSPTIRKRLFLIARCDGKPIVWPEPTHASPDEAEARGLRPWRTAAECIDWSDLGTSIFGRKRPLADATLKRIANGIMRYVVNDQQPFIVRHGHYSNRTGAGAGFRGQPLTRPLSTVCATNDMHLVVPELRPVNPDDRTVAFLAKHWGGMVGVRADTPTPTITGKACQTQIVTAFLTKFHGTCADGQRADAPMPTVRTSGNHAGVVSAFLVKYYGTGRARRCDEPLGAVTTRDRFALVTIEGIDYEIVDIRMRMLKPRELFRAQGFSDEYVIEAPMENGKPLSETAQKRLCGNSVCPQVAEALIRSNGITVEQDAPAAVAC